MQPVVRNFRIPITDPPPARSVGAPGPTPPASRVAAGVGRRLLRPLLTGLLIGASGAALIWAAAGFMPAGRMLGALGAAGSIATIALAAMVPPRPAAAAAAIGGAGLILAVCGVSGPPWLPASALALLPVWGCLHTRSNLGILAVLWCAWATPMAVAAALLLLR